jgi:hypothetical protein
MNKVSPKRSGRFLTVAIASTTIILGVFSEAWGQKSAPQRDMSDAERNVRALEIGANNPKDSKTILAEVNEDFNRLRAINDEFKTVASPPATINYKSISDDAVEIKKRGTRLRINLAGLPKAEKDEKRQKENVPQDETQMRSLLSSVNVLMSGFLTNPVFSDMGTLDNQLALKARRDLDALIELSDVVRKGAEKLAKTTRP